MTKRTIFLILMLLFSTIGCSKQIKEQQAKNNFSHIVEEFGRCQTNYEIEYNYKPIIDVKNGTNRSNLAELIRKELKKHCYDAYAGNWDKNNVTHTYIITDSLTPSKIKLIDELENKLAFEFEIDTSIKTCKSCNIDYDITLVIGDDYR